MPENLERVHKQFEKQAPSLRRFSSKIERELADKLIPHGFKRHKLIKTNLELAFDVDIAHTEKQIWIESDGEWHFKKIHKTHDFEKTQLRDKIEENEAVGRGALLIRIDNRKLSVDEQVVLVLNAISGWDETSGEVIKLPHNYGNIV